MIVVDFFKSTRSKYRDWQRKRKLNAVPSWLKWRSMFVIRIAARLMPMGSAARTVIVEDTGKLGDLIIQVPAYQWLMQTPAVPSGERLLIVRFFQIASRRSYRKLLRFGVMRNDQVLLRAKHHSESVNAEHEFLTNAGFDVVHFDRDLFRFSFIYRVLVTWVLRRMGVRRHILFPRWRPLLQEGLCMTVAPPEILLFAADRLLSPLLPGSTLPRNIIGIDRQTIWARRWLARRTQTYMEAPVFSADDVSMSHWTTSAMLGHDSFPASKHYLSNAYEAIAAWHQLPPPTRLRISVDTRIRYFIAGGDYGVFSPGAPPFRSLSPEGWAALIVGVFRNGEKTRLVLCSSVEKEYLVWKIYALLPTEVQAGIFIQRPFADFLLFGQLLRDAAYVVCEDTGTFHLSIMTGAKTIVVCDPESTLVYLPYPDVLVSPDRQHVIGMTREQLNVHDAAFMDSEVIPAVRAAIDYRKCDN